MNKKEQFLNEHQQGLLEIIKFAIENTQSDKEHKRFKRTLNAFEDAFKSEDINNTDLTIF